MKLVREDWETKILLDEKIIYTVVIEDVAYFRNIIFELARQLNGEEGQFCLSKESKILEMKKHCILISNIFDFSLNNKKIISKIIGDLSEMANEDFAEFLKVKNIMTSFFENIIFDYEIPLNCEKEPEIEDIFKLYGIYIEEPDDIIEKLILFLELTSKITKSDVFFTINLHKNITTEEFNYFARDCINKEIKIINFESLNYGNDSIDRTLEKVYTIDIDLCEI